MSFILIATGVRSGLGYAVALLKSWFQIHSAFQMAESTILFQEQNQSTFVLPES